MKKTIVLMLSLLMIVSMVSAATLEELELKVSLLENKTAQLEKRMSNAESFIYQLDNALQELSDRFYAWIHGETYTDVCGAVEACNPPLPEGQCKVDSDCGTPYVLPNICKDGNVASQVDVRSCITEHEPPMCEYYIGIDYIETCKYGCKDAKCIVPDVRYLPGKELVFDYNKDGTFDCFKYSSYYRYYTPGTSVSIAQTPEGYNIYKYGTTKVIIDNGTHPIFAPGTGCTI